MANPMPVLGELFPFMQPLEHAKNLLEILPH
jgi:hypothetical protein